MPEHGVALAQTLGQRVREARAAKEWTQEILSAQSGVSRRMIINIEQGDANPSIAVLLKLAYSLGVGLPQLVMADSTGSESDAGESAVWVGDKGGYARLVSASRSGDPFELWDWRLQPGESHSSEPHVLGTRELVHVLEGTLTLSVGDDVITLVESSGHHFCGDQPHSYANASNHPVRFSLSVHEPLSTTER
jgi:transcriptional regulator with XRE-family HTH domain